MFQQKLSRKLRGRKETNLYSNSLLPTRLDAPHVTALDKHHHYTEINKHSGLGNVVIVVLNVCDEC